MKETFAYTPVDVAGITKAFNEMLASLAHDGEQFVRAANVNSIIVVEAGAYDAGDLESYLMTLSEVHPNRAFVIVIDPAASELRAEYCARCQKVSPKEHVCSEVLRLTCPPEKLQQANSIVRANFITGMPTELCVPSKPPRLDLIEAETSMAEQVVFASSAFERKPLDLKLFLDGRLLLVDLDWVKLGIWRDQIREIFDKPACLANLGALERIEILGETGENEALPFCSLLIAGWLMARLDMHIASGHGSIFTLENARGQKVSMVLSAAPAKQSGNLLELTLGFAENGSGAKRGKGSLIMKRAKGAAGQAILESVAQFGEEIRFTKEFDEEGRDDLLKRYFFIGESTLNYEASLRRALRLVGKTG